MFEIKNFKARQNPQKFSPSKIIGYTIATGDCMYTAMDNWLMS